MICNCPENYVLVGEECVKTTVVDAIQCPPNCDVIILEDGNTRCSCLDSVLPIEESIKTPISFDDKTRFKDVSWTISFKPLEGSWNSYFTFYPDYSVSHNGFFQTGYNSNSKLWSHTLNNSSFGVFQGEKHGWALEFPVSIGLENKILNTVSLEVEARRFINMYDDVVYPNVGATEMYIYNSRNNSGNLVLNPQKSLADNRNYPKIVDGKQHIITTFEDGRQNVNYFFNRLLNQSNGVTPFLRDDNNIFKTINPKAVNFNGKRVLERMTGNNFVVHLENKKDSQFNIALKNLISDETTTD